IEEALDRATVAVLLISQSFLASDFVTGKEIPKILQRKEAGGLTLLPVYLSPSTVADIEFDVDGKGARKKIKLTQIQGFGTPDRPLSDLNWSDRERVYGRLAERLRALAGGGAPVSTSLPSRIGPLARGVISAPEPSHAYELTVHLVRSGESLEVTYHLP